MSKHMIELSKILLIARKEFMENITSKRFFLIGGVYGFFAGLILLLMLMIYSGSYQETKALIEPSTVFYFMDGLNFIMGLLAIIIASDAISSEKHERTIYQLMSKPISRSSVVIGKFLGAFGMVSVFFLGSVISVYLLSSIVTMKFPGIADIPGVLAIMFSMLMVYTVYISFGILISAVTKSPYVSMIGSLIVWIFTIFLSVFGNLSGQLFSTGGIILLGDPFDGYPLVTKVMIWLDPKSHSITIPLLSDQAGANIVGLPLWANVVFVMIYSVVLIAAAVILFNEKDI